MKEILMKTKIIKKGYVIEESYEIADDTDPKEYAQGLIRSYNDSLRQKESPRELVEVIIMKVGIEGKREHNWEKQNMYTVSRGSRLYDIYKCTNCGVTGKRFGLSEIITRDRKFKAKKYDTCEWVKK